MKIQNKINIKISDQLCNEISLDIFLFFILSK